MQPSSQPSTQPTAQPSAQPTSYPSPIPTRSSSLQEWQERFDFEVENRTISVNTGKEQLLYGDLFYRSEVIVGGCSQWTSFSRGRDLSSAFEVKKVTELNLTTIKLLYDYYELTDPEPNTISCRNESAIRKIGQSILGLSKDPAQISCEGNIWHLKYCNSSGVAMCIDCPDPCKVHCSNKRVVHYLSSCLPPTTSICVDGGKRHGIISSISLLSAVYQDRTSFPTIQAISISPYRKSAVIAARLSSRGGLSCSVYAGSYVPKLLTEVSQTVVYSETSQVRFSIDSLIPSTNYTLYCFTFTSIGSSMSYGMMMAQGVSLFKTSCCKAITVSTTSNVVSAAGSNDFARVNVEALPNSQTMIALSVFGPGGSSSTLSALIPGNISVSPSSTLMETYIFSLPPLQSGWYQLRSVVTGPGANEYSLSFSSNTSFLVLGSGVNKAAPSIVSAAYSTDGSYLIMTFNTPTDQAKLFGVFNCSKLLRFVEAERALCSWQDAQNLAIYPARISDVKMQAVLSSQGVFAYNLAVNGIRLLFPQRTSIQLLPSMIRAACSSRCSSWPSTKSTTTAVLAPNDAISPNVQINAPSILGICDDYVIDLTSSSGFGGQPWLNVTLSVSSLSASVGSVLAIQSHINNKYTLFPPAPLPRSLFESGKDYSFNARACNLLGKCSTAVASLTVLNVSSPLVSISGGSKRVISRSQALMIYSLAAVSRTCGIYSQNQLKYSWTVMTNNFKVKVESQSADPSVFILPGFSLALNSNYYVLLEVQDVSSYISSSVKVSVQVVFDNILIRVAGPSVQSVSLGEMVVIKLLSNYDVDPAYSSSLVYSSTCLKVLPVVSVQCGVDVVATSGSELYLSGSLVNTTSSISITATAPSISSSLVSNTVSISIVVVPSRSIDLKLSAAALSGSNKMTTDGFAVFNENERIKIAGNITIPSKSISALDASYVATWSIASTATVVDLSSIVLSPLSVNIKEAFVNTINSADASRLNVSTSPVNLVLSPSSLISRLMYTFSLRVVQQVENTISVTVYINGPPISGALTVTPPFGVELSTRFTIFTYLWTDRDLPLTYVFGYLNPFSGFLQLQKRSQGSQIVSILPCINPNTVNSTTNVSVQVFDSFDAASTSYTGVTVVSNKNLSISDLSADIGMIISNLGGGTNAVKTFTSVAISVLNRANCSSAPSCSVINRNPCLEVANTCGSCMEGYVGSYGAGNSYCLLQNASSAGERRRLMMLGDNEGDSSLSPLLSYPSIRSSWSFCSKFSPCTNSYEACVRRKCMIRNKECPGSACSNNGYCIYQNMNTKIHVKNCTVFDEFCEAVCVCDQGYSGSACEMTSQESTAYSSLRYQLSQLLFNQSSLENFQNSQDVQGFVSLVEGLGKSSSQISQHHLAFMISALTPRILQLSLSMSESGQSLASAYLTSLNPFLASEFARSVDAGRYEAVIQSFLKLSLADMLIGETAYGLVSSEMRTVSKVLSANDQRIFEAAYLLPSAEYEESWRINSISLPRLTALNDTTSFHLFGLQLKSWLYSSAVKQHQNKKSELVSNPSSWWFEGGNGGGFTLNCSGNSSSSWKDCKVDVTLQYNQNLHIIPPFEVVEETLCYDRDFYVQNYSCLTNPGGLISVHCPGKHGKFIARCPIFNATSLCQRLLSKNAASPSMLWYNVSSCEATQYTDYNVTCSCWINQDYFGMKAQEVVLSKVNNRTINETRISSLSVGYAASQETFIYNFDDYFINEEGVSSEQSRIVFSAFGIFVGLLFVSGVFSFRKDSSDYRVYGEKKKLSKELQNQAASKQVESMTKRKENQLFLSPIERGNVDRVYLFDEEGPEESKPHEEEKLSPAKVERLIVSNHQTGTYASITKQELESVTEETLNSSLPLFFHAINFGWIGRIGREIYHYNRYLNVFTHENTMYNRVLRLAVIGNQILLYFFLTSLLYLVFIVNQQEIAYCRRFEDERSCRQAVGSSSQDTWTIFQDTRHGEICYWTIDNHQCNYNQQAVDYSVIIFVSIFAAVLVIPIAKAVEYWIILKLTKPQSTAPVKSHEFVDPIKDAYLKKGRKERVHPSKQLYVKEVVDKADSPLETPEQLRRTKNSTGKENIRFSFFPARNSMHDSESYTSSESRFQIANFIKASNLEAELQNLQGSVQALASSQYFLGNQLYYKKLLGKWRNRTNFLLNH